jgi:DUF177 domain-containing protein
MKIPLQDILSVSSALDYLEPVEELNRTLRTGRACDYQFGSALDVRVAFYRAEQDLFFDGSVRGLASATCARCLEVFSLPVAKDFALVLTPEAPLSGEIELAAADLSQSFYAGADVDLTPLVYEQVQLALPTRPLCGEECRGLCPRCGVNRNREQCACAEDTGDPRLAVLRSLKIDRGA